MTLGQIDTGFRVRGLVFAQVGTLSISWFVGEVVGSLVGSLNWSAK